jgi:hypothetical protein
VIATGSKEFNERANKCNCHASRPFEKEALDSSKPDVRLLFRGSSGIVGMIGNDVGWGNIVHFENDGG